MPVITEVMEPSQVDIVAEYADILQIGTRNMQNFSLLLACGRAGRPVMLKRGYGATIEEWLMAAEYIASAGNSQIILCERGIRTFETTTRNTLDLTAVPLVHHLTHLPVIVDPSHATGKRWLVKPLAIGGVAVGADGIMVEVHPRPDDALSDAEQQLDFAMFESMMTRDHGRPRPREGPPRRPPPRRGGRGRVHGGLTIVADSPAGAMPANGGAARSAAAAAMPTRSSSARPRACAGHPRCPATSRSRTGRSSSRCSPRARARSRRRATARTSGPPRGSAPHSARPWSALPSTTGAWTTA